MSCHWHQKESGPQKVRVITRFAPDPSGDLHMGSLRVISVIKKIIEVFGGECILRIDDTNSSLDRLPSILEDLECVNLPISRTVKQSERLDVYRRYLDKISHCVYKKDGAIYFKKEFIKNSLFTDEVFGRISRPDEIKDFVIFKSDEKPIYHFASAVDDVDLGINTVIRGNDHITSTIRQNAIVQAISPGYQIKYFHLPMMLDNQRKKMSKSGGVGKTLKEIIKRYTPECTVKYCQSVTFSENEEGLKFHKSNSVFDEKGLISTYKSYIMSKSAEDRKGMLLNWGVDSKYITPEYMPELLKIFFKEDVLTYVWPLSKYTIPEDLSALEIEHVGLIVRNFEMVKQLKIEELADISKNRKAFFKTCRTLFFGSNIGPNLTSYFAWKVKYDLESLHDFIFKLKMTYVR